MFLYAIVPSNFMNTKSIVNLIVFVHDWVVQRNRKLYIELVKWLISQSDYKK